MMDLQTPIFYMVHNRRGHVILTAPKIALDGGSRYCLRWSGDRLYLIADPLGNKGTISRAGDRVLTFKDINPSPPMFSRVALLDASENPPGAAAQGWSFSLPDELPPPNYKPRPGRKKPVRQPAPELRGIHLRELVVEINRRREAAREMVFSIDDETGLLVITVEYR